MRLLLKLLWQLSLSMLGIVSQSVHSKRFPAGARLGINECLRFNAENCSLTHPLPSDIHKPAHLFVVVLLWDLKHQGCAPYGCSCMEHTRVCALLVLPSDMLRQLVSPPRRARESASNCALRV